ncbi:MAG: autotransporter outer membrane beta-barrel domain-containing protein [Bacteroidota bacterium]|nr:autotransporter outer membrane beta-barrel domain-containing protein [Bacteroidota bacterium]
MKVRLIILLFFLSTFVISAPAQEEVKIDVNLTGNTSGNIFKIKITNNSQKVFIKKVYPFYYPSTKNTSGYLLDKNRIFKVGIGESKTFFLEGYSTDIDKNTISKEIEWNKIKKLFEIKPLSIDSITMMFHKFNVKKLSNSDLIPFDFIVTNPGTFEFYKYKFNPSNNQQLANSVMLEQMRLLEKAYRRLYKAGKLVTHFNNAPELEKRIILQVGIWICASGNKGVALKKPQFKKALNQIFEAYSDANKLKNAKNSFSRYLNIIETLGIESKTFITPDVLEKNPKCLPKHFGYKPTSYAVRTPTVSFEKYDIFKVRNQRFDNENKCLPCKAKKSLSPLVKTYLLSFEIEHLEKDFLKGLSKNDKKLSKEITTDLEFLKTFDIKSWVKNEKWSFDLKSIITYEYFKSMIDQGVVLIDSRQLSTNDATLKSIAYKSTEIFKDLLFIYQNQNSVFNLDCCDKINYPEAEHFYISNKINELFKDFNQAILLSKKDSLKSLSPKRYKSKMMVQGTAIYSLNHLLTFYRMFMLNTQYVCMSSDVPEDKDAVYQRIKDEFGYSGKLEGSYYNKRFKTKISDKENITFVFNNCFCGDNRESTVLFFNVKPNEKIDVLNKSNFKNIRLLPNKEFSFSMGKIFAGSEGADKFNAGGLIKIEKKITENNYDSFFIAKYASDYKYQEPENFRITDILNYSFSFGYDVITDLQLRLNAGFFKGFAEADVKMNYDNNKAITDLLRSHVNSIYGGVGLRYYFGEKYKPFVGASYNRMKISNTDSKLISEGLEISMENIDDYFVSVASFEAGLRYMVNQDFFVDFNSFIFNRWETNSNNEKITAIDYGFNFTFGMKF